MVGMIALNVKLKYFVSDMPTLTWGMGLTLRRVWGCRPPTQLEFRSVPAELHRCVQATKTVRTTQWNCSKTVSKQFWNSFETVLKLFCFSFISLRGQFNTQFWFVCGQGFVYLLVYTSIQDKLQFCMLCLKHVSEMFVAAKRFQVGDLCSRLTALWRYINFVLLLLVLVLLFVPSVVKIPKVKS